MRQEAFPSGVLERGLELLSSIVADQGHTSLAALADGVGLARPTAYRIVAALTRGGYLVHGRRGRYLPGPRTLAMARRTNMIGTLTATARPIAERLARTLSLTVHLGVFDQDMVTYLIKADGGSRPVFTREGGQLEAYCSSIGKVLLAHLPAAQLDAYLAGGPFIPLTSATVIDAAALRDEFDAIRQRGFAVDDRAVADDLVCVAVPIGRGGDMPVGALSVSRIVEPGEASFDPLVVEGLREAAAAIARGTFGDR